MVGPPDPYRPAILPAAAVESFMAVLRKARWDTYYGLQCSADLYDTFESSCSSRFSPDTPICTTGRENGAIMQRAAGTETVDTIFGCNQILLLELTEKRKSQFEKYIKVQQARYRLACNGPRIL